MTVENAWKYIISHCLNEMVMDDDATAREAVEKIENVLIPFIAAGKREGEKR